MAAGRVCCEGRGQGTIQSRKETPFSVTQIRHESPESKARFPSVESFLEVHDHLAVPVVIVIVSWKHGMAAPKVDTHVDTRSDDCTSCPVSFRHSRLGVSSCAVLSKSRYHPERVENEHKRVAATAQSDIGHPKRIASHHPANTPEPISNWSSRNQRNDPFAQRFHYAPSRWW